MSSHAWSHVIECLIITMGTHESVQICKHVAELFIAWSVVSIDWLYLTNTTTPVRSINHILWWPVTFQPKVLSLYIKILIDSDIQHTHLIKRDIAPMWNTDFILSAVLMSVQWCCPLTSSQVTKKPLFSPFSESQTPHLACERPISWWPWYWERYALAIVQE